MLMNCILSGCWYCLHTHRLRLTLHVCCPQIAGFLPEVCSKFIGTYGIVVILDALFIFLVDLFSHNYNCEAVSAACSSLIHLLFMMRCFNGDFYKRWSRALRDEGSGLTGIIIHVIVSVAFGVIACLWVYEYFVKIHRDARILDIWRQ